MRDHPYLFYFYFYLLPKLYLLVRCLCLYNFLFSFLFLDPSCGPSVKDPQVTSRVKVILSKYQEFLPSFLTSGHGTIKDFLSPLTPALPLASDWFHFTSFLPASLPFFLVWSFPILSSIPSFFHFLFSYYLLPSLLFYHSTSHFLYNFLLFFVFFLSPFTSFSLSL